MDDPSRKPSPANFLSLRHILLLFLIFSAVAAAFWPSLSNKLINFDDTTHFTENPVVINAPGIVPIFSSTVNKTYVPLTTLSFAVEHHFFGFDPFVYHLNNLILHLIVTLLVFFLGLRLGLEDWAAGLAALLFGIHPMHVESVAWVTERKDVLYSVFYLLALHAYWSYLRKNDWRFYALSFLTGVLSLLAKPMALSLPLIFCLLDWFHGRKWSKSVWLDKIPFLLYTIPIAGITYALNARVPVMHGCDSALVWIWSFSFYLLKFVFPCVLYPLYLLPAPIAFSNPVYSISLMIFMAALACAWSGRKHRWVMLAFGFYFLSIFFLLRFDGVDMNPVADRFMYLPSVGFCFLFGYSVSHLFRSVKKAVWKILISIVLAGAFLALGARTFHQCQIWRDSFTVCSQVIRHNPRSWLAFYNRGYAYDHDKKFDLALADYNRSIEIYPDYPQTYINRSTILFNQGRIEEALADLNRVENIAPEMNEIYNNRAIVYVKLKRYDLALADMNKADALSPDDAIVLGNRAQIYAKMDQHLQAVDDYNRALKLDPSVALLYFRRSLSFADLERLDEAIRDARKAQALGVPDLEKYIQRLKDHVRIQ